MPPPTPEPPVNFIVITSASAIHHAADRQHGVRDRRSLRHPAAERMAGRGKGVSSCSRRTDGIWWPSRRPACRRRGKASAASASVPNGTFGQAGCASGRVYSAIEREVARRLLAAKLLHAYNSWNSARTRNSCALRKWIREIRLAHAGNCSGEAPAERGDRSGNTEGKLVLRVFERKPGPRWCARVSAWPLTSAHCRVRRDRLRGTPANYDNGSSRTGSCSRNRRPPQSRIQRRPPRLPLPACRPEALHLFRASMSSRESLPGTACHLTGAAPPTAKFSI